MPNKVQNLPPRCVQSYTKPNDQVVIGGKTFQVVSVNIRSPFNEAAIHIVQVRGGNG
jgi:hypothetical protein